MDKRRLKKRLRKRVDLPVRCRLWRFCRSLSCRRTRSLLLKQQSTTSIIYEILLLQIV